MDYATFMALVMIGLAWGLIISSYRVMRSYTWIGDQEIWIGSRVVFAVGIMIFLIMTATLMNYLNLVEWWQHG
jgi:hypothetical protein